jgi:hypothetical protein
LSLPALAQKHKSGTTTTIYNNDNSSKVGGFRPGFSGWRRAAHHRVRSLNIQKNESEGTLISESEVINIHTNDGAFIKYSVNESEY